MRIVDAISQRDIFYSLNVEVSGLRGFLRRSARLQGYASRLASGITALSAPQTMKKIATSI